MTTPACRTCKKDCLGIITCDKCKSLWYCSENCKTKDAIEHNKTCITQNLSDEKLNNLKLLQKQFGDAIPELRNDFSFWRNSSSYKTGIFTDLMIIHFQDDGTIVTAIVEMSENMKLKKDKFWPKLNPKEAIPLRLTNSKVNVVARINLWAGF